jgi:hypothetical protein
MLSTYMFMILFLVQVQQEQAGTKVQTTEAGTETEWEHFDYGYHSGTREIATIKSRFINENSKSGTR